jgi:protoporphyrinogen IX oxidase
VENLVKKLGKAIIHGIHRNSFSLKKSGFLIGSKGVRALLAMLRRCASRMARNVESRMLDFLAGAYPWTKALHIVSVVAWMAGLFYLPRLFVYHAEKAARGSELSETLKLMEARLLRQIMNPAMIATWTFGAMLVLTPGLVDWRADGWIYVKLAFVLVLTWLHHWLARRRRDFANDANSRSGRQYRIVNEVPTLALLVIVVMVVVRPI